MTKRLLEHWFDELRIGQEETTRGRTVTETDVVNWCMFTGDWFLMHSNAVYASESMYGERIAPGLMVLAISGGLVLPAETQTVIANYGCDRIRYPRPTFIGDTINVRVVVTQLEDRQDRTGLMAMRWDILNQNGSEVCVADFKALMAHKPLSQVEEQPNA
jgi:3-hydroxybutyryl-CoA dehydratase